MYHVRSSELSMVPDLLIGNFKTHRFDVELLGSLQIFEVEFQLIEVAVLVLLRVLNRTANLRVAKALPNHWRGWRRESPIGRTGRHVRASEIMVLMARAALFGGHPVTFRAAADVHGVRMPVISLPRGVTA